MGNIDFHLQFKIFQGYVNKISMLSWWVFWALWASQLCTVASSNRRGWLMLGHHFLLLLLPNWATSTITWISSLPGTSSLQLFSKPDSDWIFYPWLKAPINCHMLHKVSLDSPHTPSEWEVTVLTRNSLSSIILFASIISFTDTLEGLLNISSRLFLSLTKPGTMSNMVKNQWLIQE